MKRLRGVHASTASHGDDSMIARTTNSSSDSQDVDDDKTVHDTFGGPNILSCASSKSSTPRASDLEKPVELKEMQEGDVTCSGQFQTAREHVQVKKGTIITTLLIRNL